MRLLTLFITASEYIPEDIKAKLRPYYHKLEEKLLNTPPEVFAAAGIGILVFFLLVAVVLRVRKSRRRKKEAAAGAGMGLSGASTGAELHAAGFGKARDAESGVTAGSESRREASGKTGGSDAIPESQRKPRPEAKRPVRISGEAGSRPVTTPSGLRKSRMGGSSAPAAVRRTFSEEVEEIYVYIPPDGLVRCSFCGSENPSDEKICHCCGERL